MIREYTALCTVQGPLITVQGVNRPRIGEWVDIVPKTGDVRMGRVVEADGDSAMVLVFDGCDGLSIGDAKARFWGRPMDMPVSKDMLGRTFDGLGRPVDGGPQIIAHMRTGACDAMRATPNMRDASGAPICTGFSAIDGLCGFRRGETLAVLCDPGISQAQFAARVAGSVMSGGNHALVFCGMGLTREESELVTRELIASGAIERSVLFMNRADDPAMHRLVAPGYAMAAAEYLALEQGMDVLVIMTDMALYADAKRELSVARGEPHGYPDDLYMSMARITERAGMINGVGGSVSLMPMLTASSGEVVRIAKSLSDGQIVLSHGLHQRGICPPVDALASRGHAADDRQAEQLLRAYARGLDRKGLIAIQGEEEADAQDLRCVRFAEAFEREYISQGGQIRSMERTHTLGLELLNAYSGNAAEVDWI